MGEGVIVIVLIGSITDFISECVILLFVYLYIFYLCVEG